MRFRFAESTVDCGHVISVSILIFLNNALS